MKSSISTVKVVYVVAVLLEDVMGIQDFTDGSLILVE